MLLTSYSAMTSHKELLVEQDWHYVILDEGHKIRNPDAQITLAVKQVGTSGLVNAQGEWLSWGGGHCCGVNRSNCFTVPYISTYINILGHVYKYYEVDVLYILLP